MNLEQVMSSYEDAKSAVYAIVGLDKYLAGERMITEIPSHEASIIGSKHVITHYTDESNMLSSLLSEGEANSSVEVHCLSYSDGSVSYVYTQNTLFVESGNSEITYEADHSFSDVSNKGKLLYELDYLRAEYAAREYIHGKDVYTDLDRVKWLDEVLDSHVFEKETLHTVLPYFLRAYNSINARIDVDLATDLMVSGNMSALMEYLSGTMTSYRACPMFYHKLRAL